MPKHTAGKAGPGKEQTMGDSGVLGPVGSEAPGGIYEAVQYVNKNVCAHRLFLYVCTCYIHVYVP